MRNSTKIVRSSASRWADANTGTRFDARNVAVSYAGKTVGVVARKSVRGANGRRRLEYVAFNNGCPFEGSLYEFGTFDNFRDAVTAITDSVETVRLLDRLQSALTRQIEAEQRFESLSNAA